MKNSNKIRLSSIDNIVELKQNEALEINGGDDVTKFVFGVLGWMVESISRGFAKANAGAPGIPNR